MDSALSVVQNLERDLQEVKAAARDGKLKPLPGETVSILKTSFYFYFLNPHLRTCLLIVEIGEGREKEREKNIHV